MEVSRSQRRAVPPPLPAYESENSVETMSRLFPVAAPSSVGARPTYVLWDMSDYLIPENFHPCLVKKQIESAIEKEGYDGDLSIWVYGAENTFSTDLENQFREVGIQVNPYKGGKSTRLNLVIGEFLAVLYALNYPSNVLMLAENTGYIQQHPKFSRFREVLEDKGFFFALAHPDTLINNEDHSALMSAYFPRSSNNTPNSPLPDFPPSPLPLPPVPSPSPLPLPPVPSPPVPSPLPLPPV